MKVLIQLLKCFKQNIPSFSNSSNLNFNKFSNILGIKITVFDFSITYFGAIALSYPPFLLMILVQNFMLIKNHIETWVWKSTETKLFTSKVLKKSWKIIIQKRGHNTTIPSPCWKINKLQNNISRITK